MLCDEHNEAAGFGRYQGKAGGFVKCHRAVVLGIDVDGERADAEAIGADRGVEDQGSAQPSRRAPAGATHRPFEGPG